MDVRSPCCRWCFRRLQFAFAWHSAELVTAPAITYLRRVSHSIDVNDNCFGKCALTAVGMPASIPLNKDAVLVLVWGVSVCIAGCPQSRHRAGGRNSSCTAVLTCLPLRSLPQRNYSIFLLDFCNQRVFQKSIQKWEESRIVT